MIIYFAGIQSRLSYNKFPIKLNVLESYFYVKNANIKAVLGDCLNFFLDSGAFSSWNIGESVNIDEYMNFIRNNDIKLYAVLDVIGDAKKTMDNQLYMESKGFTPIPCFHYGEPLEYLDYYCMKYDYVALGGMVPISTNDLINWLDVVFSKYPEHKFHGFGMTTFAIIERYPWYSVDSTSYLQAQKSSSIYVNKKVFLLTTNPLSDEFRKMKPKELEEFNMMCRKYGFTRGELSANSNHEDMDNEQKGYWKRTFYNIYYFLEIEQGINDRGATMKHKQHTLSSYTDANTS